MAKNLPDHCRDTIYKVDSNLLLILDPQLKEHKVFRFFSFLFEAEGKESQRQALKPKETKLKHGHFEGSTSLG